MVVLALAWAVEGHLQELVVELEVAQAQVGAAVQEWPEEEAPILALVQVLE